MHLSQMLTSLVGIIFIILIIGFLMAKFRQPQLVGYILAGVIAGPAVLALAPDVATVEELGALGVTLLLFFIGMEVSPRKLVSGWKIAIFGTLFQIGISVLCAWLMGSWLGWPFARSILLGFVVSLSSTAVVLKLLQDRGELDSRAGDNVLLVLLTQDLAVVPMLIIISLLGEHAPSQNELLLQIGGGTLLLAFSAWIISRENIKLPFMKHVRNNHELQVFTALLICFGMAFISGVMNLSAALGSFIAGMIVATAKETEWVHHSLAPLHVVFVAIFFVSVGMLIDLNFLRAHLIQILSLTGIVLVSNTVINAVILKLLDNTWRDALYSGALLSQVGEFSFVLAAVGLNALIITQSGYQMTIAVIAISLLASPLWVSLIRLVIEKGSTVEKNSI